MRYCLIAACAATILMPAPTLAQVATIEERRTIVLTTADLIESRYVHADRGSQIAAALRAEPIATTSDPEVFAASLTERLRALSGDRHFAVTYKSLGDDDETVEDMSAQMESWYGIGVNHGFEQVRRLEGGIGYLDLRVFAPTETAADMMQSAMTLLAQSDALIIDLRNNGGGMDEMVLMLEGYLLAPLTEVSGVYNRPTDRHVRSFTPTTVPGRRFGSDKPVFVLISNDTFSAAEHFAYDMQAADRATIVGQRSGGGAHPFEFRAISDHFVLSLPESRSINPITGGDWEGTGVVPDVETPPDAALDVAIKLAADAMAAGR